MNIIDARRELDAAWNADPFSYERVAKAIALLLELCDYDLERFSFRGPQMVVNNEKRP